MQTIPHPDYDGAVDLLMQVGKDNYTVWEFIKEAELLGISKRVGLTSLPSGVVHGVSRLFVWHQEAILSVTKYCGDELLDSDEVVEAQTSFLWDLQGRNGLDETWALGKLDRAYDSFAPPENPEDLDLSWDAHVNPDMLDIVIAFQSLTPVEQKDLTKYYGIKWYPGVFGYSYITSMVYVAGAEEAELPEQLQHLEGYVEPVHVETVDA